MFDRLDANKNGLLSKNELRNGLLLEGYVCVYLCCPIEMVDLELIRDRTS